MAEVVKEGDKVHGEQNLHQEEFNLALAHSLRSQSILGEGLAAEI